MLLTDRLHTATDFELFSLLFFHALARSLSFPCIVLQSKIVTSRTSRGEGEVAHLCHVRIDVRHVKPEPEETHKVQPNAKALALSKIAAHTHRTFPMETARLSEAARGKTG